MKRQARPGARVILAFSIIYFRNCNYPAVIFTLLKLLCLTL